MTSAEERTQNALAKKQEGNDHVAKGDFKKAAFAYKMLYLLLSDLLPQATQQDYNKDRGGGGSSAGNDGIAGLAAKSKQAKIPVSVEVQQAALAIFLSGVGNLALCHLKLGRLVECCQCSTLVLNHDPDKTSGLSTRAYFRRACAKLALGDLEASEADLAEVLRRVPGDSGALGKMAELEALQRQADAKQKLMCKKMFS
jgi:hypothetical protein